MNVAVTGANGYLGGWLTEGLVSTGHSVSAFDSHGRNLLTHATFPVRNADAIVHLAWYAKPGNGEQKIQYECLERTKTLVDETTDNQFVVFASSAAVYGDAGDRVFTEGDTVRPGCCYSKCKASAEAYICRGTSRSVSFRFGSLMGRGRVRTKTNLCVNAFAIGGYHAVRIEVWNPESWKPVLHVRDAADLIVRCVGEMWAKKGTGLVVNAAQGAYRAGDIASLASHFAGDVEVVMVADRSGPRSCRMDCSLLRSLVPDFRSRGLWGAIKEFKDYVPAIEDVERGWTS